MKNINNIIIEYPRHKQSIFQTKIETLRRISENFQEDKIKDIIGSLSFFINGTNPNYYYNGTYLEDYREDFNEFLNYFTTKDKMILEFANEYLPNVIEDALGRGIDIDIEIDNVWRIQKGLIAICEKGNINSIKTKQIYCKYTFKREEDIQTRYKMYEFKIKNYNLCKEELKNETSIMVEKFNKILMRKAQKDDMRERYKEEKFV